MTFVALVAAHQPWSEAMMKDATRSPITSSPLGWLVFVLEYLHPVALKIVFMAVFILKSNYVLPKYRMRFRMTRKHSTTLRSIEPYGTR